MWFPLAIIAVALGAGALYLRATSHRDYRHGLIIGDSMLATPIFTQAVSNLTGIPFDNVAVVGKNSTQILRQLQTNFRPGYHDLVIASIGANDGTGNVADTARNVLALSQAVRRANADLVLFTEPPFRAYRNANPAAIQRSETHRQWVLSGNTRARYVLDLHSILGGGSASIRQDYNGGDGLHPNRAGRQAMAEEVARRIL